MKIIGLSIICLLIAMGFCERTLAVSEDLDVGKNAGDAQQRAVREDVTRLVDYILGSQAGFQGRTFGVKRFQFMLLPVMYKLGIMTTLLIVVAIIGLKGLTVGVILLLLQLSAVFGKFYALLQQQPVRSSWSSPGQPMHVHVHSNHPFSGYEPPSANGADEHYYYKG